MNRMYKIKMMKILNPSDENKGLGKGIRIVGLMTALMLSGISMPWAFAMDHEQEGNPIRDRCKNMLNFHQYVLSFLAAIEFDRPALVDLMLATFPGHISGEQSNLDLALSAAAQWGKTGMVIHLLEKNQLLQQVALRPRPFPPEAMTEDANPHLEGVLKTGIKAGHVGFILKLLERYDGNDHEYLQKSLREAAESGQTKLVLALLKQYGQGNEISIPFLLSYDALPLLGMTRTQQALRFGAQKGQIELVLTLLDKCGYDADDVKTALSVAIHAGQIELVLAVLDKCGQGKDQDYLNEVFEAGFRFNRQNLVLQVLDRYPCLNRQVRNILLESCVSMALVQNVVHVQNVADILKKLGPSPDQFNQYWVLKHVLSQDRMNASSSQAHRASLPGLAHRILQDILPENCQTNAQSWVQRNAFYEMSQKWIAKSCESMNRDPRFTEQDRRAFLIFFLKWASISGNSGAVGYLIHQTELTAHRQESLRIALTFCAELNRPAWMEDIVEIDPICADPLCFQIKGQYFNSTPSE